MAIKQDIKEINILSNSNAYLNLSQAEKLELLKKLISTTLALANPSARARNRESVGRLVANFEDNFIKFYTQEMGMSEKELAAFFATKLKDEQSLLSKDIPNYKNILKMVENIFKEVKVIQKETKNFDENTSIAELDSYLEKLFVAFRAAYAESSKMKRINELTTVEPIKFLAYIDKSIATLETNIALALQYGIPVDEFQNILALLKQLQSNPKQTFKMTNEEIKEFRKKVVAAKRNLTIKIKQATTVITRRIDDIKDDDDVSAAVSKPQTPKSAVDVAKFNLGKSQAKFIVDNWTKILKVDDKQLQEALANISANDMDFIRQLKLALDTNNDKLLEGLLKRVYKNPNKEVVERETLIDYIASVVGRGVGILKGVIEAEPANGAPVKTEPVKVPEGGKKDGWEYSTSFTIPGYTYDYSDQQRELWNYLNGFENAGQDVAGEKPVVEEEVSNAGSGDSPKPSGGTPKAPTSGDGVTGNISGSGDPSFSGGEGLTSRGDKSPSGAPITEEDNNPLDFPVEETVDEDETVEQVVEEIDKSKKGKKEPVVVSDTSGAPSHDAEVVEEKEEKNQDKKTEKKGFWATIGGGLKAVGKWMLRHPVLTLTAGALIALPFGWANALTLIPKLVVYGAGALVASNGVKALARAIIKPYNRFIHKYDVDAQQKKLDKRMRKRAKILEKINTELADAAVREGVAIPSHTPVQVKDKKINKQYAANAEKLAAADMRQHTPVSGMDSARVKRLQGLSDELVREEAAIAREREAVLRGFDRVENIDNLGRNRQDLYEADRAERRAFERRTDMTPTAGDRQAVEVGRMGRKGIGAAANAETEVEELLREREEIDARAHRQLGRETNAEKDRSRKTKKPSTSSYDSDRDDSSSSTPTATSGGTTSTTSSSAPAGPTKKELKAQKKAEKEEAKRRKKNEKSNKKNTPVTAETTTTKKKPVTGIAKKGPAKGDDTSTTSAGPTKKDLKAQQRQEAEKKKEAARQAQAEKKAAEAEAKANKKKQAAIDNEIKSNRTFIDEILVQSANCQDFWNRLDTLGLSAEARLQVKKNIDPVTYAGEKAQAQARMAKQTKVVKPGQGIAKKAPARKMPQPKTWQDVVNQQLLASADIEDYLNRIKNYPNMPQDVKDAALRQNNIMNFEQRKVQVAAEVDAQVEAEKQAQVEAQERKKRWDAQIRVYDNEIKAKKGEVDKAIAKSKSFEEFQQIIKNDKSINLTEGARLRLVDVYTVEQYESRKLSLTEAANRQQQRDEQTALRKEIATSKEAIQEIFETAPTLAEYQRTIDDMGKKGVLSQGAVKHFKDMYTEKDFANKANRQAKGEKAEAEQIARNEQERISATLKKNKAYFDNIAANSKTYEEFLTNIENDANISNDEKLVAAVKKAYPKEVYTEIKINSDVKKNDAKVKELFDKCDYATTLKSKQEFDKEIDKMVEKGIISVGAGKVFKSKYSAQVFQARSDRKEKDINALARKHQKDIDNLILNSKSHEEFLGLVLSGKIPGITKEQAEALTQHVFNIKYYSNQKTVLEAQAKQAQEKQDKIDFDAEVRKLSGSLDKSFNDGSMSKAQFDKYLEDMMANGQMSKAACDYFKSKYTAEKFAERDRAIETAKKRQEPGVFNKLVKDNTDIIDKLILNTKSLTEFKEMLLSSPELNNLSAEERKLLSSYFTADMYKSRKRNAEQEYVNKDVKQYGNSIKTNFDEYRNYSKFEAYLKGLLDSHKISQYGYKYFMEKYSAAEFEKKERRLAKPRTAQDVNTIMSYFNQCIDLDKANNIVEYIKLLEAKLGYEFTREAKETICSKISNAAFKEQKTGKTIGQMDVKQPSKLNVPIASKALKIWRECKGDVKVYREEIDKLAITEANKVYLKSADYIATLRRISDKDKSM